MMKLIVSTFQRPRLSFLLDGNVNKGYTDNETDYLF